MVGADDSLYGTTYGGGSTGQGNCLLGANGCGTVFNMRPPPNPCITVFCPWDKNRVSYRFWGTNGDGDTPYNGDLVFDSQREASTEPQRLAVPMVRGSFMN